MKPMARMVAGCVATLALAACGNDTVSEEYTQPVFGATTYSQLKVDGYTFKDMNRNGKIDPYEDWRLSAEARADDLLSRMSLDEKAGLMMHGTAPTVSDPSGIGLGGAYDLTALQDLIVKQYVNTFITRMAGDTANMASQYNKVQEISETSRHGIPVSISTDPRHHFQYTVGASAGTKGFSQWPETLGLAAIGDDALVRRFGDIARQEYLAVGITQALSPQADLATEPRWSRINGTFGEDADLAKRMVQHYIEGFQDGNTGLHDGSVVAVVKHWVGYGATKEGFDGHNYYGRYMTYPGNNFAYHVKPFEGAFTAKAASVMPTYALPDGNITIDGITLEQVAAGFSKTMLTDLLRGKYGFEGVILSDWGITSDCDANCRNGTPAGVAPSFIGFGTPWGMENATKAERYVKAVTAGMDQFGGVTEAPYLTQAVQRGQLTEARINASARRILIQKFKQGLFEHPFVDAAKAATTVGKADFIEAGLEAQRRSLVLLENKDKVLPLAATVKKVYLYGIDAAVAKQYGYTVVATPQEADVALLRVAAPYEILHPNYIFGSMQHEGRLNYVDGDADYEAIKNAAKYAPKTVVTVYLDRPAILGNVQDKASAILANFGVSDGALFDVLTGKAKPQGKLPFELPSSMAEVQVQKSDVPYDTAHPLYKFGYGLAY
ncbi:MULTISPECIES: glycoside hydrolase family 3 protein [unclassified Janthinobacterium]|uniref:glycoside hydrolase family 3 protein n=1 Tax=unclassified Janthinobacterium TaxID=2610881 RepID=UPI0027134928|nr:MULTISPECIES: glycoside hydrolase family 3 N-terminal domain-containing protein [unclassified Janthinobacterium]MDO8065229.1 glycoside hydrolase family 3 C-terminal domain-containing protein [Janthinobacterium sp. SUN206]MDO8071585.1 glycoside hydrolase family 3 C-terminal domain-containing protein [Janthinobacterium sp. SUN176]